MADNIAITAGSGTTVATDELTINAVTAQVQRMKLALGKDGTFTADLGGRDTDAAGTGALYMDPRPKTLQIQSTPVVSVSPAYSTADCMGPLTTVSSVARISGGAVKLEKITVVNKMTTPLSLDFVFFDRTVTTAADNAAFQMSDADALFCQGWVNVPTTAWMTANANNVNASLILPQPLAMTMNASDLFVQVVTRTTVTLTSTSDIVVTYWFTQL